MSYLGKVDMNDANIQRYTLTSSTASTVLFSALGWTPANIQSLRVTINGVVQQNISLTSTALDLGGALVATDELEVIGIESMGNIITPADNSVSTAKLADDAVTTIKILDDNVTLAKMAGGTDGNLITYDASGNPAHVLTGAATQVLTSNGAGAAPTFEDAAGGGLTQFSQFRLTTSFTGAATPIATHLVEVGSPVGFGKLPNVLPGAAGSMTVDVSGNFTFPSTGYWLIDFHSNANSPNNVFYRNIRIFTTTNNSTYVEAANGYSAVAIGSTGTFYWGADARYIFDVTDTGDCKVQFQVQVSGGTVTTVGNADYNQTYMTFLRLADT